MHDPTSLVLSIINGFPIVLVLVIYPELLAEHVQDGHIFIRSIGERLDGIVHHLPIEFHREVLPLQQVGHLVLIIILDGLDQGGLSSTILSIDLQSHLNKSV